MGSLKKTYELSLWRDVQGSSANFTEERVAVIGADSMTSLCRALTPKLKKGINGSKELTFKMYKKYIDPISGEEVNNPYVDMIANESKIKLKYREKWYDLIVKNIQQDSSNHTVSYTATDLFTAELSKNGYNLVMDASLMNNMGTLQELATSALADTGWQVVVESAPKQYIAEQVVELKNKTSNTTIYAFYSSCKDQPIRFQYATALGEINSEGVYSNPTQTYIDMRGKTYTTDQEGMKYGFTFPVDYGFVGIKQYKVNRIVYTHKSRYNAALNKMVYSYNSGNVEGFSNTEYLSPNLILNFVTNNSFKSTSGWTGSYMTNDSSLANKGADNNALVEVVAMSASGKTLIDAFKEGNFSEDTSTYTPALKVQFQTKESILINSGFYDNRNNIKNLAPGQKFVLLYKQQRSSAFNAYIGVAEYNVKTGHYANKTQTFLTFNTNNSYSYSGVSEFSGYRYIIGEVPQDYNIADEKTYKKLKTQLFIQGSIGIDYVFYDMQLFPYYDDPNNPGYPMLPTNTAVEASAITEYFYYSTKENSSNPSAVGYRASEQEYKYCAKTTEPAAAYTPDFTDGKVGSITIKQSNYFNIIQTLCERFEVWADFDVTHDETGRILQKTILFKENIANPNPAGFKYGVNLKSAKRTLDSKAIVTKLIVPDGTNEFAPNGFCSIARAGGNQSGENFIYDFTYYYNFGLLDKEKTENLLSKPRQEGDHRLQGYYIELLKLNSRLNVAIDRYSALSKPLMQADANKQVAEAGRIAASESYEDAADAFLKAAGYTHTEITVPGDQQLTDERVAQIEANSTLKGHLTKISEYYTAWQKYIKDEQNAEVQYQSYKQLNDELVDEINRLNEEKEELNKLFYQSFYRFIQEGTWKSDEYTDHEKYYNDAYTTLKNSSVPKVSYTFGVVDIATIEGYEEFEFDLADLTWVEDPELFGTSREEVVVTEVVYALDEPWNNSVKVQNYRDQFADLFQKVTATTQQVKYAAGAWEKAATFAEANPVQQAAFLQNALADAEMKLQNAGEQSVVWDKTGITVTDLDSPNQQLRIIGGAILLRDQDNDGLGWKVGITPKGISAKLLTAGQVNTSVVSIMNGDEPYFRWDAYGISAYYFNTEEPGSYLNGLDTSKGVRFDRFGIYGYNGKDGSTWHPDKVDDILENSMFALTWEGLFLRLGHGAYKLAYNMATEEEYEFLDPKWHITTSKIGRAGKYIYNTWVDGYPSYDPTLTTPTFVKVFTIADAESNEQFVIYDDGTLVANNVWFTGSVKWVPEASPARSVYGPIELANNKPNDKWYYKDIPDHDPGESKPKEERWHKIKGADDVLYCHTDTAGAVWDGPFLITGRSIKETIAEYSGQFDIVEDPSTITNWSLTFPVGLEPGMYLYIRQYDKYDDGTISSYRYSASYFGTDGTSPYAIDFSNDSATISASATGEINLDALKKITAMTITVWSGSTDITSSCMFSWSVSGGTLQNTEGNVNNFTEMSEDTASAQVLVLYGTELLGIKEFSVSKTRQGEDAVLCYIHSSMGNLFENNQEENTVLTAYIYRGEVELDPEGTEFEYSWYIRDQSSMTREAPIPNLNTKQVTVAIQDLINKDVYFTAQSK